MYLRGLGEDLIFREALPYPDQGGLTNAEHFGRSPVLQIPGLDVAKSGPRSVEIVASPAWMVGGAVALAALVLVGVTK